MFVWRLVLIEAFIAVFFVGLANCAHAEEIRHAELEVMAGFLNDRSVRLPKTKSWVIDPTNAFLSSVFDKGVSRELRKLVPQASRVVVADIVRYGEKPVSFNIPRKLVDTEVSFSVADKRFLGETFKGGGLEKSWKGFYEEYPTAKGLVRFSRVGVDAKTKQALLYVEIACGGLCGSGNIVFLRNTSGRWKIVRSKQIWIS